MKFFRKNELGLLWPFYLDAIFSPLLFFAPIFIIVFLNNLGLSFSQIGILIAISPLAALLFEIPTGAIADLYGRKVSVLLGYAIESVAMLSLFFLQSYYSIMIAFIVIGFASTLSSGSKEAWIVDLVKSKKISNNYFHKSQSFDAFALIISGFLGVILVKKFGISSVFVFAFFSYMISISILLFAKENYIKKKVKIKESFFELFKQTKKTLSYGYRHHVLYYYLVATFVFGVALSFGMSMTWTPLLLELNFPQYAFGYLWSAIAFITMITPIFSGKLLKKNKERRFIMISLFLSALFTVLILFPKTWLVALIYLLVIDFFLDLMGPASKIYFHRFAPSKLRATMGSVDAMLVSLAAVITLPVVGYLVDVIGPRYALFIYAPLMLIVVFIYSRIKEGEK